MVKFGAFNPPLLKVDEYVFEIVSLTLKILVLTFLGLPIAIFGLYGAAIMYYAKLKPVSKEGFRDDYEPSVSIVIPTHNEESIISKRIENLLSINYPQDKIQLILVDDSTDSTPRIIESYTKNQSNIRLVRFSERMGYSPSMIAGLRLSQGELTILADAGSFLDADAIKNLVRHFKDPQIGAVTGKDEILNTNEEIGKSEGGYQRMYNLVRTAESRMDSTFYVKGEATAVRTDLAKKLERCFETFDTSVGLFVRQNGFKTIYDPQVKFYEYTASTHSDRVKQKTIRAANLIKVILRFRSMMFNRKYGKYGSVILPMNLAMLTIAPISIMLGIAFLVPLTFLDPLFSSMLWLLIILPTVLAFLFARHLLHTFLDLEYSLLKAIYEIALKRKDHDKIEKVASTRRA